MNEYIVKDRIGEAEVQSDDPVDLYLREIGQTSVISKEETLKLFARLKEGDETAKEELIVSNMRLVTGVAIKKYKQVSKVASLNITLDDLIQEGMLGLILAIDNFDLTKGCAFTTYATPWVRKTVNKFLTTSGRTIRIPDVRVEAMLFVYAATCALESTLSRAPTPEEVRAYTNNKWTTTQIVELQKLMEMSGVSSLDTTLEEDEDGEGRALIDTIPDESLSTESLQLEAFRKEVEKNLATLSAKDRFIIRHIFGLDAQKMTLEEISKALGAKGFPITKQGISLVKLKWLKRMKKPVERVLREVQNNG